MRGSVLTSDFDYGLPGELVAQTPILNRDGSRLMLLNKQTGAVHNAAFSDITGFLKQGDCLVVNNTKVIPARLIGEAGGKAIELLLLKRVEGDLWEALAKPGKRLKEGACVSFGSGVMTAVIESITPEGNRLVRFFYDGIFSELLDKLGEMPLPPYITEKLEDRGRYQTVYARYEGSAAAPTAGLHFTERIISELKSKGVKIAEITLHVGLGTFRPVKCKDISEHVMHSEYYNVEREQAEIVNAAREGGGRIVAVGTTVCRTLETLSGSGELSCGSGWTDIFICPGYEFRMTDALLTNFHLPKSTLLMLVSAMAGRENILSAYNEAVRERYRFFSFGDAMLIL